MNIFTLLMLLALTLQVGCFTYSLFTSTNPLDVLAGYSIWGMIPVWIFALLSVYSKEIL